MSRRPSSPPSTGLPGRRLLAGAIAAALALTGLTALPAAAEEDTAGTAELTIEGAVVVVPDESGTGTDQVTLVTETGDRIELDAPAAEPLTTGDQVVVDLRVEGDLAQLVTETGTPDEAAAVVAEAHSEPVEVTGIDVTVPVDAVTQAQSHTVDIMSIAPSGHARPDLSGIDAMVGRLSEFWASQSNRQVAGITRNADVRFGTMPAEALRTSGGGHGVSPPAARSMRSR